MKTLNLKRILFAAVAATGFAAGSAMAAPTLDTYLAKYESGNSGAKTELAMLNDATGLVFLASDLKKIDGNGGAQFDKTSTLWVLTTTPTTPGYFLLKFGMGSENKFNTPWDSYVFQNLDALNQLVWRNQDVDFLTGGDCTTKEKDGPCNIDRLSHVTWVAAKGGGVPGGGGEVPEPASLALLGAGLAGMLLRRRRA